MEKKLDEIQIKRYAYSKSDLCSSQKSSELYSSISNDITHNNPFQNIFTKKNKKIYITIMKYLEYKDILALQLINKSFYLLIHSKSLSKLYAIEGLINSPENRILFYESNIDIKNLYNALKKELVDYKIESKIFENILKFAEESKSTDKKFCHVCDEINRDINRTFYTEKFVEGNGKKMLINILTALAFIRPEIGYCQGMNFIAGALINCFDNEEKCFWIFLSFIDNIEMNSLYSKNLPDYSIRVYQLSAFIKEYFPELATHFKKNQINLDVFFSKWILTIFSNYLPFEVLYKVWDVFIFDKWKAIFIFSLLILNSMKDKLMTMDLITFSKFIKDNKNNSNFINFEEFSKHYKDYKITNRQLNELREEFFIEQVQAKIEAADTEWETDQSDYVNNYKKELEEHLNNFGSLIDQLKAEIGKINIEYERKSKKYEEKLKKVNELKMKLEAQIEVKAGYEKVLKRFSQNDNNISGSSEKEENINNDLNKDEKKKSKFSFIRNKSNVSEYDKLQKKLNHIMKEIDINNKSLFEQYKKLQSLPAGNNVVICVKEFVVRPSILRTAIVASSHRLLAATP